MIKTTYRASVLVPTHNRAKTLRLAVASALAQTVSEVEVIIIGDGVTDEVRTTARALAKKDARVVFLDRPKTRYHGEEYRHEAIVAARSNAIFYLCDDDLFLPEHVENLLDLLRSSNFVQSLNGFIRPSGELTFVSAVLSRPETIALILRTDDAPHYYNAVGITGTAHSRDFYLAVDRPWETTPPGRQPDHFQWCKMFDSPDLRASTSLRMTAISFPTSRDERERWTEQERLAEMRRWAKIIAAPGGQKLIDELVRVSSVAQMDLDRRTIYTLLTQVRYAQGLLEQEQALREQEQALREQEQALREQFTRSFSWRITAPLRLVRGLTRRRD
jgi:hypothetical protein